MLFQPQEVLLLITDGRTGLDAVETRAMRRMWSRHAIRRILVSALLGVVWILVVLFHSRTFPSSTSGIPGEYWTILASAASGGTPWAILYLTYPAQLALVMKGGRAARIVSSRTAPRFGVQLQRAMWIAVIDMRMEGLLVLLLSSILLGFLVMGHHLPPEYSSIPGFVFLLFLLVWPCSACRTLFRVFVSMPMYVSQGCCVLCGHPFSDAQLRSGDDARCVECGVRKGIEAVLKEPTLS